jgi:hypothetical protein
VIIRLYKFIGLVYLALILQGCPPPSAKLIFNNTGTDLIVQLKTRNVEWYSGTFIRIANESNTIKPGELVWELNEKNLSVPQLTIKQKTRILIYKFSGRLTEEYVGGRSSGKLITKWQIESDENMYITLPQLPQSMYPVKMPIHQPPGFPLKPVISRL